MARIALVLPFAGLALFWLQFGNPFTMQSSDWGMLFWLCLFLGGAGLIGVVLSAIALKQGDAGGWAWGGLVLNGLAILFALGTIFG